MFEAGELIMCGGHGVCRVTAITGNPIDKLDKKRKYYILEPVFEKGSTIYTPVDNDKIVMRKILDEKAAKLLIGRIPDIETVWIKEENRCIRKQSEPMTVRVSFVLSRLCICADRTGWSRAKKCFPPTNIT